jgi:hypothetical protein
VNTVTLNITEKPGGEIYGVDPVKVKKAVSTEKCSFRFQSEQENSLGIKQ